MRRAFDYYAEVGDLVKTVEIAENQLTLPAGYRTGIADLVARALSLVSPDSYEAGRLQSTYGRILGVEEGDNEGAQQAFSSALIIAQREKNQALEMRTLVRAVNVDLFHFNFEQGASRGLRAIELAQQVGDQRSEFIARFYLSRILETRCDLSQAKEQVTAMLDLARMTRDRYYQVNALLAGQQQSMLVGDWSAARESSEEALGLAPADPRLFIFRGWLEHEVGEFNEGELYLERLLEIILNVPSAPTTDFAYVAAGIPVIARITGVVARFEEAVDAAKNIFSSPFATPYIYRIAEASRGLTAVVLGDGAQSKRSYDALESSGGVLFAPGGLAGTTDRLLGLLSFTTDELDQGVAHFENALALCYKAGFRPELAWTCCDYADTLLQRGAPGDREKAMSLLDESLAISNELGMRPLLGRVLSRREILKA
jgi:hypothetical protein